MPESERRGRRLAEGGTAAAGLCVFALFVHRGLPLVVLSGCGLAAAALGIGRSLSSEPRPTAIFGLSPLSRRAAILIVIGCIIGVALGGIYRWSCDRALFPGALRAFALLAGLIGAAEELVYRGYIQGRLRGLAIPAVLLAALCHTAYKLALFALPVPHVEAGLGFLALWTLLGGLLVGTLRELGGNVVPALAAHVCFDVIVYGDLARGPWWVWS